MTTVNEPIETDCCPLQNHMTPPNRTYIALDLKSFYASVECVERGMNPLTTNLVVADADRTEKTICLAVSPSLKAYGIPGRTRLFDVVQTVREVNAQRQRHAPDRRFSGESCDATVLEKSPGLAVSYITATPRMAHYIRCSTRIYEIYLQYVSPEDIHVYSIDEVFIDATDYLKLYQCTPREMAMMLIRDVLKTTGITATAGIGSNLYLAKVAMDIHAKHIAPDHDGVRIAELDEKTYRSFLWTHTPLTDFWRIGRGSAAKLEANGLYTMGDIARCSCGKPHERHNEALLYSLFGINAELLIDHAWGWEPCTLADIKAYKPASNSLSSGQVLPGPYTRDKAKRIVREMADLLVLELVEKKLLTDQIVLDIGYDISNLSHSQTHSAYRETIAIDPYGRKVPRPAHGTLKLEKRTSSTRIIVKAAADLFDRIADNNLLVRRIHVTASHLVRTDASSPADTREQLDLFTDVAAAQKKKAEETEALDREHRVQEAVLAIRKKYGKNAILKGMNLEEGSTAISRNNQIGGHRA